MSSSHANNPRMVLSPIWGESQVLIVDQSQVWVWDLALSRPCAIDSCSVKLCNTLFVLSTENLSYSLHCLPLHHHFWHTSIPTLVRVMLPTVSWLLWPAASCTATVKTAACRSD